MKDRLSKPGEGKYLLIGRVLFHVNWAKTGTWGYNTLTGDRRVEWFALCKIIRKEQSALSVTVGPFKLVAGIIQNTEEENNE